MRVGRQRTSNTKSASSGSPFLKPKDRKQQGEPGAIQRDELLDPGAQGRWRLSSLVSIVMADAGDLASSSRSMGDATPAGVRTPFARGAGGASR